MILDYKALGSRIAVGAFWTVAMRISVRLLGLVSVILLARLLVPEDFGIVAKASMISSFLEMIATFGLEAALIHNQRAVAAHYNTVWTIHVIRGALIAIALSALALPAAEFFREPALAQILWFYGLAAFLNGLVNVGTVDFCKNLDFDKDFRFTLYRKLAGFVVTVLIALIWRSYWAFVVGVVVSSATAVFASFLMSPYRPRFTLEEWRSLFDFSKWIFLVGLVSSISGKLDTFILSRFSATETVGQYTVSYELAGSASTEVAMPIARATMPGLAILNEKPAEFREMYRRTIAVLLLISMPAGLGLAAVADQLTLVVLGDKWRAAGQLIEILAVYGAIRAVFAVSASAFQSSGKVKLLSHLMISNLILRSIFLSAGFWYGGVVGMAWGVLFVGFIQLILYLVVQHAIGFLNLFILLRDVWRVLFGAIGMYAGLVFVLPRTGWLEDASISIALAAQVLVGAALYAVGVVGLWAVGGLGDGPERTIWNYARRKHAEE
ncbi:lipopolysaccharide biosynthesis protein [Lentisalinibacter salinarum]|uniref:lipopolysaccharide biosynthesis protein n=1 Tax=Lentisalinibacter salinarum TaxID=2992239 RepID=UPI00386C8181